MALGVLVSLVAGPPSLAQARDQVFAWIAPSDPVDAYTLYLGQSSGIYSDEIDIPFAAADADGVTRSIVTLDDTQGYYVVATASYQGAESSFSNEIFIAPSVCDASGCDDGNPCTVDGCNASGCTHSTAPDGMVCGSPGQTCHAGICQVVNCSDGNVCNGEETLNGFGVCVPGAAPDCGVPTQCADPVCDPVGGCMMMARPDWVTCDDGNPFTEADHCQLGWCVGQTPTPSTCPGALDCPQSKEQGACINVLTKDLTKVAAAQIKIAGKCIQAQARSGESAEDCLASYDSKMDKVVGGTDKHMGARCMEAMPDFGPDDSSLVNVAGVQAALATLDDLFGPDLDAALVTVVDVETDKPAATCQAAVFKGAAKCEATWFKEFGKCQASGLKGGTIGGRSSLADCFGFDPKGRIAKACDRLESKILPATCSGVDKSDAFPGHATNSVRRLSREVRQDIECRVCETLSATHGLSLDCNTCP